MLLVISLPHTAVVYAHASMETLYLVQLRPPPLTYLVNKVLGHTQWTDRVAKVC